MAPPLVGRYLSTVQMLDHLLDVSQQFPRSFHIAFAFDYDVNNILKDLPFPALIMLKERGAVSGTDITSVISHIRVSLYVRTSVGYELTTSFLISDADMQTPWFNTILERKRIFLLSKLERLGETGSRGPVLMKLSGIMR